MTRFVSTGRTTVRKTATQSIDETCLRCREPRLRCNVERSSGQASYKSRAKRARYKPNSITLAGWELAPNQLRTSSELAVNMFGASSEPASVMEFGFIQSNTVQDRTRRITPDTPATSQDEKVFTRSRRVLVSPEQQPLQPPGSARLCRGLVDGGRRGG